MDWVLGGWVFDWDFTGCVLDCDFADCVFDWTGWVLDWPDCVLERAGRALAAWVLERAGWAFAGWVLDWALDWWDGVLATLPVDLAARLDGPLVDGLAGCFDGMIHPAKLEFYPGGSGTLPRPGQTPTLNSRGERRTGPRCSLV